jgi:hypothetical protein
LRTIEGRRRSGFDKIVGSVFAQAKRFRDFAANQPQTKGADTQEQQSFKKMYRPWGMILSRHDAKSSVSFPRIILFTRIPVNKNWGASPDVPSGFWAGQFHIRNPLRLLFSRRAWEIAFDDVEKHSQVSCQIHQRGKFHSNQYLALNGRDPASHTRLVLLSVSFFPCSSTQWRVGQP